MEEKKETAMEIHVYKYGMRLRPYDLYSQPKDGLVCVGKGGTVDGYGYYNFIYYIKKLDRRLYTTTTSTTSESGFSGQKK